MTNRCDRNEMSKFCPGQLITDYFLCTFVAVRQERVEKGHPVRRSRAGLP